MRPAGWIGDGAKLGTANAFSRGMTGMTYVETWKSIAALTQRSERWCRYMAKSKVSPLPVYKVGGIVRLDACDYQQWIAAQKSGGPMDLMEAAAMMAP